MANSCSINQIRLADVILGVRTRVLGVSNNKMMVVTQGCSHTKCPGCMSPHTWSAKSGALWNIDEVIALATDSPDKPTGLVISGGEPLDQHEAIAALIKRFRQTFDDVEVIVFTAYRPQKLRKSFLEILTLADVVVAGPYVKSLPGYSLLGSANQEVMLLSPRAKETYNDWQTWQSESQVFIHNKQVTLVGLQDVKAMKLKSEASESLDVFFRE